MKRGWARGIAERPKGLLSFDFPLFAAIAAMPAVVLAAHLPSGLLMPALAAVAFATAAVASAIGCLTRTGRDTAKVTIWDFAGGCVMIGVAAGVFSEQHHVLQLLGIASTTP